MCFLIAVLILLNIGVFIVGIWNKIGLVLIIGIFGLKLRFVAVIGVKML